MKIIDDVILTFETYPNIKLLNEINKKCIFLWFSKCKTRNVTSGYNNDNILKLEIFSNSKHKSEKNVADLKKKIFIIHKPSLWSRDVPHKIWARSVQPF